MALTRAQERAVRVGGCGGLTPWREDLSATQFRHCPARGEPAHMYGTWTVEYFSLVDKVIPGDAMDEERKR